VNGRKIYISRVEQSDLMILLARTTALHEVEKRSKGLSVFLVDLRESEGVTVRPRRVMMNNATSELAFEGVRLSAENLIGEEGEGFLYILDGMNAERILIAAECVGDGRWFVEKATQRAGEREVFGRPIGENQGIQFPIARAYADVEAASLMVEKAAALFDRGESCGAEANLAKLLAADASWEAANAALQTFGGYGFDAEYDVERKFRETRLYQVAPISTNLILSYVAEHVLGLPRSF
jgi:acyl-CoA dehydrogenase